MYRAKLHNYAPNTVCPIHESGGKPDQSSRTPNFEPPRASRSDFLAQLADNRSDRAEHEMATLFLTGISDR
jgi:hypothetical protein